MDLLRSWIYGHERPKIFPSHLDNDKTTSGISSVQDESDEKKLVNVQHADKDSSKLRQFILKIIPLQSGDCLGCKLVGTSVMVASGIIVLTSAMAGRKRNPSLVGRKLTTYYIVCGSLFVGFQTAAVCRFFDLGPFGYLARRETKDFMR